MRRCACFLLLFLVGLFGCSAGDEAEAWTRNGNAAFVRGDLEHADSYWSTASRTTLDPGILAYNRGIAAMAMQEFREAERWFLRAEADESASPQRRAMSSYHRGTALLSGPGGTAELRTAINEFRKSLDSRLLSDEVYADARHNLELAKERYRESSRKQPSPPPSEVPEALPPELTGQPERLPKSTEAERNSTPTPAPNGPTIKELPVEAPNPIDRTAPGGGSLPVLLDADRPPPMSPEQGKAWLDRIAQRLKRDRIRQAELLAGPERKSIRDW